MNQLNKWIRLVINKDLFYMAVSTVLFKARGVQARMLMDSIMAVNKNKIIPHITKTGKYVSISFADCSVLAQAESDDDLFTFIFKFKDVKNEVLVKLDFGQSTVFDDFYYI